MATLDGLVNSALAGRIGRREFVQRALLAGISAPAALAFLEACSQSTQTGGPVHLDFMVWSYAVDTIQDNIKNFEQTDKNVTVTVSDTSWNTYHDTMATKFTSGAAPDVAYSSDHWLREWVAANWIVPLDDVHSSFKDYTKEFPMIVRAAWGYTVETATAAIRMVLSGVFDAHPRLKIILGHLGETLPFLVWRIDHALARPGQKSISFRDLFCSNFHITTSGNFSTPALLCCVQEMGVDRIMFAVDWPFVANKPAVEWMKTVPLCDEDKIKILSTNAKRLFRL